MTGIERDVIKDKGAKYKFWRSLSRPFIPEGKSGIYCYICKRNFVSPSYYNFLSDNKIKALECICRKYDELNKSNVYAQCQLRPNPSTINPPSQTTGTVTFRQRVTVDCRRLGMLCMRVQIQGLLPNVDSHYVLHVHQSTDLTNGCESMGPHFNPLGTLHGGSADSLDMRHLGDFGNVRLNSDGRVDDTRTDYLANLVGNYTIIERGLVLHAMRDDLGLGGTPASQTTGNAGARLACCAIQQTQA